MWLIEKLRIMLAALAVFWGFLVCTMVSANQAILILDGSGSMWGQVDDTPKIDVARDVINEVLIDWNKDIDLGIFVYGHRRKGDCSDIEMIRPVSRVNNEEIARTASTLNPKGKTPLTETLRRAAFELRYEKHRARVILVSDGEETCGGDPCAMSKELSASGIDFTVHVVGFDVSDEESANLRCVADNTGGIYFRANDSKQLHQAMEIVEDAVRNDSKSLDVSVVKSNDLIGIWNISGYECIEGITHQEQMRIRIDATGLIIATKTIGDDCVRSGEVTWRGKMLDEAIVGEIQGGLPSGTRDWTHVQIDVVDYNTLKILRQEIIVTSLVQTSALFLV